MLSETMTPSAKIVRVIPQLTARLGDPTAVRGTIETIKKTLALVAIAAVSNSASGSSTGWGSSASRAVPPDLRGRPTRRPQTPRRHCGCPGGAPSCEFCEGKSDNPEALTLRCRQKLAGTVDGQTLSVEGQAAAVIDQAPSWASLRHVLQVVRVGVIGLHLFVVCFPSDAVVSGRKSLLSKGCSMTESGACFVLKCLCT